MELSNLNWDQADWQRLATAVREARFAQGLPQGDLAQRAGISRATLQKLERNEMVRMLTLLKIEKALGWPIGHAEALLAGRTADMPPAPLSEPDLPGLPLRIVQELQDGPVLDAQVLGLSGDDGARMIVVVKGRPNATPEQIRKDLLAWTRVQRELHRITEAVPEADEAGDQ